MIFISVAVQSVFEEKTGMYLFSAGKQHFGTWCFALLFAFSSFGHLCFRSYLPGSSFLMNQLLVEVIARVLRTDHTSDVAVFSGLKTLWLIWNSLSVFFRPNSENDCFDSVELFSIHVVFKCKVHLLIFRLSVMYSY